MSMRINTNLDALNAQRNLSATGLAYSKSVQKLSSGLRINSAADDAAGLTISEKLRAQTAGLAQASRNAQDGISMIQTGEGALNETASILQRMRELTVQGGNDTLQASDRGAIKSELDQLSNEINRISSTTQFNGQTLLNGSISAKGTLSAFNNVAATGLTGMTGANQPSASNVSAPVAAQAAVRSGSSAAAATIGTGGTLAINGVNVNIASGDTRAQVVTDINATTGLGANGAVTASLDAANHLVLTSNTTGAAANVSVGGTTGAANTLLADLSLTTGTTTGYDAPPASTQGSYQITVTQGATAGTAVGAHNSAAASLSGTTNAAGNLVINGVSIALAGTETIAQVETAINNSGAGVTATGAAGAPMTLTRNDKGSQAVTITSTGTGGTNALLSDLGLAASAGASTTDAALTTGKDVAGTYSVNGGTAASFSASNGTTLVGGGIQVDASKLSTGAAALTSLNSFTFTDTSKAANLQIGANSGQTLSVGVEDMSATALGVGNLDVSNSTAINAAGTGTLAKIDQAIASVSSQRATLGAYQNRLEHTISNLGVSQSNLTASESRIRDVDMAAEMVNFTKTGILQQAGQAILAQANQSGSGVMSLLR